MLQYFLFRIILENYSGEAAFFSCLCCSCLPWVPAKLPDFVFYYLCPSWDLIVSPDSKRVSSKISFALEAKQNGPSEKLWISTKKIWESPGDSEFCACLEKEKQVPYLLILQWGRCYTLSFTSCPLNLTYKTFKYFQQTLTYKRNLSTGVACLDSMKHDLAFATVTTNLEK